MLPPIDPFTLQSNPQFAALYKRLTTTILNPDGSAKVSTREAQSQAKAEEDLIAAQTAAAKISILRFTLRQILSPDQPNELQDFITILSTAPSPSSFPLLTEILSSPPSSSSLLSPIIASRLSSVLNQLSAIADPESSKPLTATQISLRHESLAIAQHQLEDSRITLADAAADVLKTRRDINEAAIRVLEGVKYGTVARGANAEATYLALVAECMGEKLRVVTLELLQSIYTPDVLQAIESHSARLESVRAQLSARRSAAEEKLAEYEAAGDTDMREIVRTYMELRGESESLKAQIKRLGGVA
ncbi:hypothetical protein MMC07_001051 [Pseudocyphellaria aurata]|nr:hypothetical protein [Pseudocyphellaria aurata]